MLKCLSDPRLHTILRHYRLFHRLDPISPDQSGGYWPTVANDLCPECLKMTRDKQHNPDPNENAARIVAGSQAHEAEPTPGDLEAAWLEWSRHIQKVDERAMTLLKAAFEAGWDACESSNKNGQSRQENST